MKIYEIGTGYTPIPAQISAATEIVVEELAHAMKKQGQDVRIVDIRTLNRAETELPILEVPVPALFETTDIALGIMHKLKRVIYSVSLAGVLKRVLKSTKEKVVFHFHNQYNLFFFLKLVPEKLRNKCVIAYTNHSGIWRLPWNEIEETIRKRYFQEAECMKKADQVFVLNEETKQNIMIHLGVAEKRIVLIGNGVNTDIYRALTDEEKNVAKKKMGLDGYSIILQVGSVYENKGQDRAIKYLLPLLKQNKKLIYAYAGGIVDEIYQDQIQQFINQQGLVDQIRYLGMLRPGNNLNELYNCAVATILPSNYEAFGLAAVESMAAGVPILIDGHSPIYFGKGCIRYDCDDNATMVARLLNNVETEEYVNLCLSARETVIQEYSWEHVAGAYCSAWEQIA